MVQEDPAAFPALARAAFSFLLVQGFRVTEERDVVPPGWDDVGLSVVRYESAVASVDITWNTMERAAAFKIACLRSPRDPVNEHALALVTGAPPPASGGDMAGQVADLAALLSAAGGPALRGEPEIYDRVRRLDAAYTRGFTSPRGSQPPNDRS